MMQRRLIFTKWFGLQSRRRGGHEPAQNNCLPTVGNTDDRKGSRGVFDCSSFHCWLYIAVREIIADKLASGASKIQKGGTILA